MDRLYYGVDYYPEHRSEEEFTNDLELFSQAGINVVRMGEFAWRKFEPSEGSYQFQWMEDAINRLGKQGVQTILCTPTASPPVWLSEKYPETNFVMADKTVRTYGGRRHYCPQNPKYLEFCAKIADTMAQYFADNPFIIGWHIDNELGQETTGRCQCPVCTASFRKYLEAKYKTIEEFNQKTGTVFWGMEFDSFNQINPPLKGIEHCACDPINRYYDNPGIRLEFERASSQAFVRFIENQAAEIRKYTKVPITTNATGIGTNAVDYYEAFKHLDVYAYDTYPDLRGDRMSHLSFSNAFARGIMDKAFWIVEIACGGGHGLWGDVGVLQPYPGAIKQEAIYCFVTGAQLVTHFQFAAFPFGAEQLDGAILDADNQPRRRFYELKSAAQEIKELEDILMSTQLIRDTAIILDYDCYWALKIKPPNKGCDTFALASRIHRQLVRAGIAVDIIPKNGDFSKYKSIILPGIAISDKAFANKLEEYTKEGGNVIATFLTAFKDENNTALKNPLPGFMTDLFGVTVGEYEPVFKSSESVIKIDGITRGKNCLWTEVLEVGSARAIGKYADTFRIGQAVISENDFGKGKAYYLGTMLEDENMAWLFTSICGRKNSHILPDGVERVVRKGKTESYCFYFNFTKQTQTISTAEKTVTIQPKCYLTHLIERKEE